MVATWYHGNRCFSSLSVLFFGMSLRILKTLLLGFTNAWGQWSIPSYYCRVLLGILSILNFYLCVNILVNFVDGVRLSISTAELKKVKVGEVNTRPSEHRANRGASQLILCKAEDEDSERWTWRKWNWNQSCRKRKWVRWTAGPLSQARGQSVDSVQINWRKWKLRKWK